MTAVNSDKYNDLTRAVHLNDIDELGRLLNAPNVNINRLDANGMSALHTACREGRLNMVLLLLNSGANVEQYSAEVLTALQYAVNPNPHPEIIDALVSKGAGINMVLLELLNSRKHREICKFFIDNCDMNSLSDNNDDRVTPLTVAAKQFDIEMFEYILKKGARPYGIIRILLGEYKAAKGVRQSAIGMRSPEMLQVYRDTLDSMEHTRQLCGRFGGVSEELENEIAKAKKFIRENNEYAPLPSVPPEKLIEDMVLTALNYGASLAGNLFYAVDSDSKSIATLLLKKGADVNERYENGSTVVMEMVSRDMYRSEWYVFFIENGLDINLKDNNGYTIIMRCVEATNIEMTHFFVSHGSDPNSAIRIALYGDDPIALLDILVELGADPLVRNTKSQTLLIEFISEKKTNHYVEDIIQLLLKHGVDINTVDANGNSALAVAVAAGETEIVQMLIKEKANVNTTDGQGRTLLQVAKQSGNKAMVEIVQPKKK